MARKVLLIGWDAADWKIARPLVEAGVMPNLAGLMRRGISGNIATLHPPLSPMLWTSISTGKRPPKHGILGFSEVTPDGKSVRPITIQSRKTKALWNILSQNGKKSIVVGWWPSHPAEPIDGVLVSDWFRDVNNPNAHLRPVAAGSVHPPELIPQISDLRVSPYEIDGAMLKAFVPDFDKVDQERDKSLHALAKIISEAMTVNAVATELLATQPWDFAAVYFDAIDHFGHRFMAYHPPHTKRAVEEIADLYRNVVVNAYTWHDAMLGELLATAGDDVTVILTSDHGFHSDHLRPGYIPAENAGPAVEHRHYGMLVMAGPGIRNSGDSVYGAVLTDICPTILRLFDLKAGADMDGKLLLEALDQSLEPLPKIPSWDEVDGPNPDGRHSKESEFNPGEAAELYKRLQDLGYVDPLEDDVEKQISQTLSELKYNEARALLESAEPAKAVDLFRQLMTDHPTEFRFVEHLVDALLTLDNNAAAREVIERFEASLEAAIPAATERLQTLSEQAKSRTEEFLELWKNREANPPPEVEKGDDVEENSSNKSNELMQQAFMKTLYLARNEEEAQHLIADEHQLARIHAESRKLNELASGNRLSLAMLHARTLLHPSSLLTDADRAEARTILERVDEQHQEPWRAYIFLAHHWLILGEFQKADTLCKLALETDPENNKALTVLAESAWKQGNITNALEAASESVSLLWFQPSLHLLIGLCLERLGEPENAARMLESALKMSPMLVRAHAALGRIYWKPPLNQPVLATRHQQKAEELVSKIRETRAAWTSELEKILAEESAAMEVQSDS